MTVHAEELEIIITLADILREEGFTKREMETHFGLKILDEQDDLLRDVTSVDNWYLTMGDSDVF